MSVCHLPTEVHSSWIASEILCSLLMWPILWGSREHTRESLVCLILLTLSKPRLAQSCRTSVGNHTWMGKDVGRYTGGIWNFFSPNFFLCGKTRGSKAWWYSRQSSFFYPLVEFFGESYFPSGLHCCPLGDPLWNGKALSIKTIYESF